MLSLITQLSAFHQDGVLLWSSLWVKVASWLCNFWMCSRTFHCVVRKTYCTTNSFIELLAPVERIPSSIFCCVGPSSGVFLTCVVSSVGPFLQKLQNCSCRGSIWRAQLGPKGCCKDIWPHTGLNGRSAEKAHQMLPWFNTPQAMVRSWTIPM